MTDDLDEHIAKIDADFDAITEADFQKTQAFARAGCRSPEDHAAVDRVELIWRRMRKNQGTPA